MLTKWPRVSIPTSESVPLGVDVGVSGCAGPNCLDNVVVRVSVPVTAYSLLDGNIILCRNEVCGLGAFGYALQAYYPDQQTATLTGPTFTGLAVAEMESATTTSSA